MIFERTLTESKLLYYSGDIPVYVNPTEAELMKVFNATAGESKGLLHRNGSVYVWPSVYGDDAEHTTVFNNLNIKNEDVWVTFYMWMNPSAFFRMYRGASVPTSSDFDVVLKTSVSSNVAFGAFSRVVDKWSPNIGAKLKEGIPGAHWLMLPGGLYDLTTLQGTGVANNYEAMKTVLLGEYKDDI